MLSAYLLSADWGDGRDKASTLEIAGLVAGTVLTAVVAVWLTRRLGA